MGKPVFLKDGTVGLKALTSCHQNVCQGDQVENMVGWLREECCSWIMQHPGLGLAGTAAFGEQELNALLSSKHSPRLCLYFTQASKPIPVCAIGIGDPALCLYSSKAYCNKNECFPVKLIQHLVLSFRRMFFILC